MKNWNVAFVTALCGTLFFTSNVSASDQDLLDTLFQNGVLNKTQYDDLTKKLKQKLSLLLKTKKKIILRTGLTVSKFRVICDLDKSFVILT